MGKDNKKISVVIPSAKKEEEKTKLLDNIKETIGYPVDIFFEGENKRGLTQVYQKHLDESPNDIIVYMHDDVTMLKKGWGEELVSLFQKNPQYGIIGIAGAKEFGVNGDMKWWSTPRIKGMLFHGTENSCWFSKFSDYDLKNKLSEVVVVDGVFFAVNRDKIEYDFDTELEGFHFYDIDFCLANFLSKKCRIGVTDRIALRHESVGQPNEEWIKNSLIIKERYKNNLPIKIFR